MRLYAALVLYCICHCTWAPTLAHVEPTDPRQITDEPSVGSLIKQRFVTESRSLRFFYNQRYRARDLWDAITEENFDRFMEIVDCECVYLDERDEDGQTALHMALRIPNEAMAIALIRAGADVNAYDSNPLTPLHIACFFHLANATSLLLESGADVNAANDRDERAVTFVQTMDDVPTLRMLLAAGAEINYQDTQGETPLHEASAYGSVNNAQFLIDHGANVTIRDNDGNTPRDLICFCERFDEREAQTCFDGTCSRSDKRALRRLFNEAEQQSNSRPSDAITVIDLWTAIIDGSLEGVEEILDCDCNDRRGEPIPGCTCVAVQEVTQSRTADWDEGQTALHLAVLQKDIAICRLLIEDGARADFSNAEGDTPLHLAVRDNSIDIVELLLEQGISADGQNNEGQSALHITSRYGFIEVTQLLVDHGAALALHDEQGATPIEIVCNCLLLDNCPEESCKDGDDVVELMTALNEEDEEDQQRVVQTLFPETAENNRRRSQEAMEEAVNDDDDDGSSLGTFVGVSFVCAFVFGLFYLVGAYAMHRRDDWERKQALLARIVQQAGPSNSYAQVQALHN